MDYINRLALRCQNNRIAKLLLSPFWHMYLKYKWNVRNRKFRRYAPELLRKVNGCLQPKGITFWLDFGTLLGVYREHDFLKHDLDIDCGAFVNDLRAIEQILKKSGFKLLCQSYVEGEDVIVEQTYIYKEVTIDFFYYSQVGNNIVCHSFSVTDGVVSEGREIVSVKRIELPYSGFKSIDFIDENFLIPANVEEYLMANYGDSFMTPNPHFDYKKEAKNIVYYTLDEKRRKCYLP